MGDRDDALLRVREEYWQAVREKQREQKIGFCGYKGICAGNRIGEHGRAPSGIMAGDQSCFASMDLSRADHPLKWQTCRSGDPCAVLAYPLCVVADMQAQIKRLERRDAGPANAFRYPVNKPWLAVHQSAFP